MNGIPFTGSYFYRVHVVFHLRLYADAAARIEKQKAGVAPVISTKAPVIAITTDAPKTQGFRPEPTPTMSPAQIAALETARSRSKTESFDLRLDAYAKILCNAVNTSEGDIVLIEAPIEASRLSALLTGHCYEAGAAKVYNYYMNKPVANLNMRYLKGEALKDYAFAELGLYYAAGKEEKLKEISLLTLEPPSDSDISEEVAEAYYSAQYKYSMERFADDMDKQTSSPYWTLAAYPTRAWAELVYPELAPNEALEKLWEDLFSFMYIDGDGTLSGYNKFNAELEQMQEKLNGLDIRELYYISPTIDLHVKLHEGNVFEGGATDIDGGDYYFNIPSMELFAMPDRFGVDGTLKTTRPFSVNGNLDGIVEGLELTVRDGRITDFKAQRGYETFKEYLEMDDNNYYFGETSLVSSDTPIFKNGRFFYTTLLDENACCHLALGDAYEEFNLLPGTVPDENVNESDWHVDIMVGSSDLDVIATLGDGSSLPILENGVWAIMAE